jgi:glutaredoxin
MITIFGSDNCFHCLKSKQLCEAMQIEHEFVDVYKDSATFQRFKELFPDAEGIPQIMWKGKPVGGYIALTREIDNYITTVNDEGESDD